MFLGLGVAGEAAFFDNALGIGIGFAKDFLAADLGLRELLFDFGRVRLSLLDGAPTLFKNGDHWCKSELFEDHVDDKK